MPVAIEPSGGGGTGNPTGTELAAYYAAINQSKGNQTGSEQAVVKSVEAKAAAIGATWKDTGGPGGFQAANAIKVAQFAARLEAARAEAINQWARATDQRKAQAEMHGADTKFVVEMYRLLLEATSRLNASPY